VLVAYSWRPRQTSPVDLRALATIRRRPRGRGKVRNVDLTCGDPDRRARATSADSSAARIWSWSIPLLPRSERPGSWAADKRTALEAVPQPPNDMTSVQAGDRLTILHRPCRIHVHGTSCAEVKVTYTGGAGVAHRAEPALSAEGWL